MEKIKFTDSLWENAFDARTTSHLRLQVNAYAVEDFTHLEVACFARTFSDDDSGRIRESSARATFDFVGGTDQALNETADAMTYAIDTLRGMMKALRYDTRDQNSVIRDVVKVGVKVQNAYAIR